MKNAAILLCAGRGTRMQGVVNDKILAPLAGRPVVCHSVDAFVASEKVDTLNFVYRDDAQKGAIEQALAHCAVDKMELQWTLGGTERQDSVFNALIELSLLTDYVFIHDCARPLIQPEMIRELTAAVERDKAAVLAHRVTDTIKKASSTKKTLESRTLEDIPRSGLWAMETPQVFEREMITDAYRRIRYDAIQVTDDTAAVAREKHPVTIVENRFPNPKLTAPADLAYMEFLLQNKNSLLNRAERADEDNAFFSI